MAYIAAFLMAAMMLVITLDVVLRNLGYQSSAHFFTFTEYALLVIPCMGAPWLAREKGHIYVEILLMSLPPRPRARLTMLIGLICIAVCLVIAWYGFEVTIAELRAEREGRALARHAALDGGGLDSAVVPDDGDRVRALSVAAGELPRSRCLN